MEEEKVIFRYADFENPWLKESLRSLRNKLLLGSHENKVFCVSSLYPKEGVSTIVRLLALYLSDIHKKVIVVSADLKKRDIDNPATTYTLKDYLSGDCTVESVVQNVNENYQIIVGSSSDNDHSDLLYLKEFTELIAKLKVKYDIVLIDAPSFSVASEANVLARLADSLILVVKCNSVKIGDFCEFIKSLKWQNISIRGVVLNQINETENLEIKEIM